MSGGSLFNKALAHAEASFLRWRFRGLVLRRPVCGGGAGHVRPSPPTTGCDIPTAPPVTEPPTFSPVTIPPPPPPSPPVAVPVTAGGLFGGVGGSAPATCGYYGVQGVNAALPSESACAAQVNATPLPENTPGNTPYNAPPPDGVPSYFYQYEGGGGGSSVPSSDFAEVDGNYSGTTPDIVRVYSCEWGIDENTIFAEMVVESGWNQGTAGDYNNPPGDPSGLPVTAITPGGVFSAFNGMFGATGSNHYDSFGILQDKVYYFWPEFPMVQQSTPFAVDVRLAQLRACMNGDSASYYNSKGSQGPAYAAAVSAAQSDPNGLATGTTFQPNETNLQYLQWGCIGSHFSGSWYDPDSVGYNQSVASILQSQGWPGGTSLDNPPACPAGL